MVDGSEGNLKRGTIYVTLYRMEQKGLIESRAEARPLPEVGIPRRLYRSTGLGERAYRAQQIATQTFFSDGIVVTQ